MGRDKDVLEARRFFDNLVEFVSDCSDQSTQELERELQAEGIDTDTLVGNVQAIVNAKLASARLGWQQAAKLKAEQVKEKLAAIPKQVSEAFSRAELIQRIQSLVTIHGHQAALEHRNFQEMTDEDLLATLEDLEQLTALKKDSTSSDHEPE